ncbi:phage terminase family protein [Streptomyces phaeochromogenes]|uniref:hypothetical protein n=1 Tax=Streptomyces phaeochromogenes TaxID=1923 RepID=UPI0022542F44|nr:hypothetical protein [Streptomyces phaeochromogenes]MCX5601615.1 phage terminase family protein [Streptomyces phaeochromogenes]
MPWRAPEYHGEFPSLGWLVGEWIEQHCVIPDGDHAGEAYRLTDEMWTFLAHHYRLRIGAEPGQRAPAFRYRRSQLVRPQKWGKGPFSGALICGEGVGPVLFLDWAEGGEVYDCRDYGCGCGWVWEYEPGDPMGRPWPTPLIQIAANSEDQTANVYSALQPMIELGPLADLIPDTGDTRINLPGGGRIDPVTSRARTRLGQRVTFVVQDETGLWTVSSGMVQVAETQRRGLAGMGGRSVETTNSWDPSEDSVAQRTAEARVKDIYRDHKLADPRLQYKLKADRKKIHRVVYGDSAGRGGWVDLDAIEGEAAELIEKDLAQAERFFGNRVVSGTGSWLERAVWDLRAQPREVPDGTRIVLGFDGSDVDDWTGFRAETLDGYQWTPTYGPDQLPTVWDPADYDGQVPRLEVDAALDELMNRYEVVRGYFDPPYWETEVDTWADRYGEKRVTRWYTLRHTQMHAACERTVTDVTKKDSTFFHDGCATTRTHVGNARKAARPANRYVLKKASVAQKIDFAVISVLAHEAAGDAIQAGLAKPKKKSKMIVMR